MFWAFSQPAEGWFSSYLLPEPVCAMRATPKYFAEKPQLKARSEGARCTSDIPALHVGVRGAAAEERVHQQQDEDGLDVPPLLLHEGVHRPSRVPRQEAQRHHRLHDHRELSNEPFLLTFSLQGDPSVCFLGFVDIRAKVVYAPQIKMQLSYNVNKN